MSSSVVGRHSVPGLHGGLLTATQGDGLLIHWLGRFTGAVLVAFLVAYVNAWLFVAVSAVCASASPRRYVTAWSGRARRLRAFEPLGALFDFIQQLYPRAPPLS